jgi:hypothetical protein
MKSERIASLVRKAIPVFFIFLFLHSCKNEGEPAVGAIQKFANADEVLIESKTGYFSDTSNSLTYGTAYTLKLSWKDNSEVLKHAKLDASNIAMYFFTSCSPELQAKIKSVNCDLKITESSYEPFSYSTSELVFINSLKLKTESFFKTCQAKDFQNLMPLFDTVIVNPTEWIQFENALVKNDSLKIIYDNPFMAGFSTMNGRGYNLPDRCSILRYQTVRGSEVSDFEFIFDNKNSLLIRVTIDRPNEFLLK